MKRLLITSVVGLFFIVISSCSQRHVCEAYGGKSDCTKYKLQRNKRMDLIKDLSLVRK